MFGEVRVIPARASGGGDELVGERAARWHRRLADVRHAIHASRHVDAVPVNGGRLRQVVGEDDAYKVAFAHAQFWPRYLVVVSPGSRRLAFHKLIRHGSSSQAELAHLSAGERCERGARHIQQRA